MGPLLARLRKGFSTGQTRPPHQRRTRGGRLAVGEDPGRDRQYVTVGRARRKRLAGEPSQGPETFSESGDCRLKFRNRERAPFPPLHGEGDPTLPQNFKCTADENGDFNEKPAPLYGP